MWEGSVGAVQPVLSVIILDRLPIPGPLVHVFVSSKGVTSIGSADGVMKLAAVKAADGLLELAVVGAANGVMELAVVGAAVGGAVRNIRVYTNWAGGRAHPRGGFDCRDRVAASGTLRPLPELQVLGDNANAVLEDAREAGGIRTEAEKGVWARAF